MSCVQCGATLPEGAVVCQSCGAGAPTRRLESYAGFWRRILAASIDGVLVQVATVFVVAPIALSVRASLARTLPTPEQMQVAHQLFAFIIGAHVHWLYCTISESSAWQATLGKKILALRVTDERGRRLSFGQANARYWSKLLSLLILGVGFLMIAFTEKKQGLHDKLAKTLVLKAKTDAALR